MLLLKELASWNQAIDARAHPGSGEFGAAGSRDRRQVQFPSSTYRTIATSEQSIPSITLDLHSWSRLRSSLLRARSLDALT